MLVTCPQQNALISVQFVPLASQRSHYEATILSQVARRGDDNTEKNRKNFAFPGCRNVVGAVIWPRNGIIFIVIQGKRPSPFWPPRCVSSTDRPANAIGVAVGRRTGATDSGTALCTDRGRHLGRKWNSDIP